MALGGKVDDAGDVMVGDQLPHAVEVADVGADKGVVGRRLYVAQVVEVSGVGELVDVDYPGVGVAGHEAAHYVAADEPGSASYQYIFHFNGPLYIYRLLRLFYNKSSK